MPDRVTTIARATLGALERRARTALDDAERHVRHMREALDDTRLCDIGPGTSEAVRAMAQADTSLRLVHAMREMLALMEARDGE